MDPELIAYFDRHFSETPSRSSRCVRRPPTDLRAARGDLPTDLALREETSQQISALREDMVHRFEQADDTNRQTRILVEDLRRHTA